jgi:hypothetical protein
MGLDSCRRRAKAKSKEKISSGAAVLGTKRILAAIATRPFPRAINRGLARQALCVIGVHQLPAHDPTRRPCLRAYFGIGRRDRHRLIWLAGEPQRVPDFLEYGPMMAYAQGLIPLKDGWRFHDQTLFRVEHWRSFLQSAVRNVKGQGEGQRRRRVSC